jgi:hypothetical protein
MVDCLCKLEYMQLEKVIFSANLMSPGFLVIVHMGVPPLCLLYQYVIPVYYMYAATEPPSPHSRVRNHYSEKLHNGQQQIRYLSSL